MGGKSRPSPLNDIPTALPALMKEQKIQQRCASVGFDLSTLGTVLAKVHEEIDEVMREARQPKVDSAKLAEEVGYLLFVTVTTSRHLSQTAEVTLQQTNRKFERCFCQVEAIIDAQRLTLAQASLAQMEQAWQQVKRQGKSVSVRRRVSSRFFDQGERFRSLLTHRGGGRVATGDTARLLFMGLLFNRFVIISPGGAQSAMERGRRRQARQGLCFNLY